MAMRGQGTQPHGAGMCALVGGRERRNTHRAPEKGWGARCACLQLIPTRSPLKLWGASIHPVLAISADAADRCR